MRIASSSIQMEVSHLTQSRQSVHEKLETWGGQRRPPASQSLDAAARPEVMISREAGAAQAADATHEPSDPTDTDPRLAFLKHVIETLTGRPIRLFRSEDLQRHADDVELPAPEASPAGTPRSAGFGLEYSRHTEIEEHEALSFSAEGQVRTADGQEIHFQLEFDMERSFHASTDLTLRAGEPRVKDPLVLDFGGAAAMLTDTRFEFDLDADGNTDDVPLLGGGRGYLAFDRNANGAIDDGRELFGPASGDGFAELAALDDDSNGWIDEADAAFAQLSVWSPASEGPGQITGLSAAGVGALYLGRVSTPFSLRNADNDELGALRTTSIYLREDGSAGTVSQIDLSV